MISPFFSDRAVRINDAIWRFWPESKIPQKIEKGSGEVARSTKTTEGPATNRQHTNGYKQEDTAVTHTTGQTDRQTDTRAGLRTCAH